MPVLWATQQPCNFQVSKSTNNSKVSTLEDNVKPQLARRRRTNSQVYMSAIFPEKTSLISISSNWFQVKDSDLRALKLLSIEEQANHLVMDTSNSTQKKKQRDASRPWTTLFSMDKLLESSPLFPSSITIQRPTSLSRISIRMWPNRNYMMPLSNTEKFNHASLRLIPIFPAKGMHTFNIKAKKKLIRQLKVWMARTSRARRLKLTSTRRSNKEITKHKLSSTTCLLRTYLRAPTIANLRNFSLSTVRLNPHKYNATSKTTLRTTVMSALRIQRMLRLPCLKWTRSKSLKINSWLLTSTSARRITSPLKDLVWTPSPRTCPRHSTLTSMLSSSPMMSLRSN